MQDVRSSVLSVEGCPFPYFRIRLLAGAGFSDVRPGQFVMVGVQERLEPFLRRAFSIHDATAVAGGTEIEILGKVIGRGTRLLSELRPGDELSTLGPLGRPFDVERSRRPALIAGGVGSAPLLLLGRRLLQRQVPFDFFYGGRSKADLSRSEVFEELAAASGGSLIATTEDGSRGREGLVTVALGESLAEDRYDYIYACGPMPLLAALARMSVETGVPGEAALETPMGCGYGACLGCAVPHASGRWALCCKDGPVFRFDEVVW